MIVSPQVLQAVVKLFVTSCSPNYVQPWQMEQHEHSVSSGFIISGRRIMCNAHGVADARVIRIRKQTDGKKWKARIAYIGHECDLAILEVDEEEFWKNTKALQFGEIPKLQASVIVVGYPIGGDRMSVTKGVVSRVGYIAYAHSQEKLLSIQIDAAINDGNSGGPVIRENKVIGVAFQSIDLSENLGYCIPSNVILHFLKDIERNGKCTGFPDIGFGWQAIENPTQKKYLGLKDNQEGILISRVYPLTDAYDKLQKGDVVLKHDDIDIACDGTVQFRGDERISHNYITNEKYINDNCKLTILRENKIMEINVKCSKIESLVAKHLYNEPAEYFILGGLIFIPLSQPLLEAKYGIEWIEQCPISLANQVINGMKTNINEQVIILSDVLSHDENIGYHEISDCIINNINGIKIINLKHMIELLENLYQQHNYYINIECGMTPLIITLDLKICKQIKQEILNENQILHDRSENLRNLHKTKDKDKEIDHKNQTINKSKEEEIKINEPNNEEEEVDEEEAAINEIEDVIRKEENKIKPTENEKIVSHNKQSNIVQHRKQNKHKKSPKEKERKFKFG